MPHQPVSYQPFTVETLAPRLGALPDLARRLGGPPAAWRVREVGDGNLNLVFIVDGPAGALIVKQALPYIRLVGEGWPLPLSRSFFEYQALTRQAARDPGRVPEIFHFDQDQAVIVMEYLTPHIILRHALIEGRTLPGLGRDLGLFLARTLFRGSDLALEAATRKADLALFAGNAALCDITERLVFSDPYCAAPLNRHTPGLDDIARRVRDDTALRIEAQVLKTAFATRAETLLHGDLHTGSVMVSAGDTRVIDPEFALYGPIGFDIGMLLSNFWMAFLSQPGHEHHPGVRRDHGAWILDTAAEIWRVFVAEFSRLWHTERTGMLYERRLFEDRDDTAGAEAALDRVLAEIWRDALGFAGIEMHRRILGLAHNADFETIADPGLRARCETRALILGRRLALERHRLRDPAMIDALIREEMP